MCPENWDLRTGNLNDGVASEDSGSEKSFSEQDEEEGKIIYVSFHSMQSATYNVVNCYTPQRCSLAAHSWPLFTSLLTRLTTPAARLEIAVTSVYLCQAEILYGDLCSSLSLASL